MLENYVTEFNIIPLSLCLYFHTPRKMRKARDLFFFRYSSYIRALKNYSIAIDQSKVFLLFIKSYPRRDAVSLFLPDLLNL